jgi:serine/threonine protein kinase
MASELQLRDFYSERSKGMFSSDIFSTGCVIFYYVTRGTHPFGNLSKLHVKFSTINKSTSIILEKVQYIQ